MVGVFVVASLACTALSRSVSASGSAVYVNGSPIITFRASSNGVTPGQLAAKLASRLSKASGKVAVRRSGDDYVIKVGGDTVLTITRPEAVARGIDRKTLAYRWAGELQRVLEVSKRSPSLGQGEIRLPVGDSTARLMSAHTSVAS